MSFFTNTAVTLAIVVAQLILAMIALAYAYIAEKNFELQDMVAYSMIIAAIFLVPSAVISEWRKNPQDRSKLTWKVMGLGFICGLLGWSVSYNTYVMSLKMVSSTTTVAILNLYPAITFVMAVLIRVESLRLQTWEGRSKIVGILIAVSRTMILSFCKGHVIQIWHSTLQHSDHAKSDRSHLHRSALHQEILGFFLAAISCVTTSASSMIQAKIMESFPDQLSTSALIVTNGAIQCVVLMLFRYNDRLSYTWIFKHNALILIILFAGVFGSGIIMVITNWCIKKKGPFFVSIFSPVTLFVVAFFSPLVMNEKLYIGSFMGAIIIVGGVYIVLWAKNKEEAHQNNLEV